MQSFKEWLLSELRSKSYFNRLSKRHPGIPRYIAKDVWANQTGSDWEQDIKDLQTKTPEERQTYQNWAKKFTGDEELSQYNKKWKLETVKLHWNVLAPHTKNIFIKRKFGLVNPYEVSNDEARFKKQRELYSKAAEGENEPVVMFYENGLYDLQEGYHRTMIYLLSGGGNPIQILQQMKNFTDEEIIQKVQSFRPVRLNAWVGY